MEPACPYPQAESQPFQVCISVDISSHPPACYARSGWKQNVSATPLQNKYNQPRNNRSIGYNAIRETSMAKILIVDDDVLITNLMNTLVTMDGNEAFIVNNSAEALAAAPSTGPD